MTKPKIKQAGRSEAVSFAQSLSMTDMRAACKAAENPTFLDMVTLVRRVDPSLTLSNASSLAKGVYAYLNETE